LPPSKNLSQSGASGSGPRVRNMNATLGVRRYGYRRTLGRHDAAHSSSSSLMLCHSLAGARVHRSSPAAFASSSSRAHADRASRRGSSVGEAKPPPPPWRRRRSKTAATKPVVTRRSLGGDWGLVVEPSLPCPAAWTTAALCMLLISSSSIE
jgi:hypothetical protein